MGPQVKSFSGFLEAGRHTVVWNGTNDKGVKSASGMYFYKLSAGAFEDTKKMVPLK
jgi:flagellar hook assembly protein FlgD